ncbi:hypothetical protein [Chryseobacterium sp.]|uniref:hypothetical protein n=1 Tax=Chryseobacterium sp. TaxID=1871047 RepID=UPI00321B89E7
MKLNKFLLPLVFCTILISAQKNAENIDGVYHTRGAAFVINKNKTFLVIAYATLIKGTWNVEKDLLYLKPMNPEAKFFVYARKNPDIKTGMRIHFSGNDIGNSNIVVGEFPDKMQSLFNDNANCLSYPSVHIFKDKMMSVTLLEEENEENWKPEGIPRLMYNFPTGDYNDFIIEHMQDSLYHKDFVFKITKNGLSEMKNNGPGEVIKKSSLEKEFSKEEDREFINQSSDMTFASDYKLVNYGYNTNTGINGKTDLNYYKYDKVRNVYTNPSIPAKELDYKSKDYHYSGVLMKFDRIAGTSQPRVAIKKLPKPLFVANCNP